VSVQGIDHVEFYVEDAEQSAAALADAYGFRTGHRPDPDRPGSVLLRQGAISLLFTAAPAGDPGQPAAAYTARHGDGVGVIALNCRDADAAHRRAVTHGARPVDPGTRTVSGFGDVSLRFVPQRPETAAPAAGGGELLDAVDHFALCVPAGRLAPTVRFCEEALGFRPIFREYIEVGDQGMDSTVVQSPSGEVTFTLIEPDTTRSPGQIDDFLRSHDGIGVQHVALRTDDIVGAVRTLSGRGVGFLSTPGTYYDALAAKIADRPGIAIPDLRDLHILLDQDHGGHLFQIFARTTHPRRTFFFELIERRGASTFGTANITALYEAVERQRAAATTPTA
jgi:4-hydroxymandelate synthase